MFGTPAKVLLVTAAVVAASSALLPAVTGYGTVLFQGVALGGWALVATLTSNTFADRHDLPVWLAATLVNVLLYLLPALAIWGATRRRRPGVCEGLLLSWCAFYLASLFVLFPATDGP